MPCDPRHEFDERPDGAISGTFWDYDRRFTACRVHAAAEGYELDARAVIEGYDRALHPWIRGWRFGEIQETLAEKVSLIKQRLGDGGSTTTATTTTTDGDFDE